MNLRDNAGLASYWIVLFSVLITASSCNQARPNEALAQNLARYQYPHPQDWLVRHIPFYIEQGDQLKTQGNECSRCHAMRDAGISLNSRCTECHKNTTSETREASGVPERPVTVLSTECAQCHSKYFIADDRFKHFPAAAGLCRSCHEVSEAHLKGSDSHGVSTEKKPETCYRCHARKDEQSHIHPALLKGTSCLQCHNPHSSTQRYFLREATLGELCARCHLEPEGRSLHGPVHSDKECLNCHAPHSTQEAKLLQRDPVALCLSCHDHEIQTQFAVVARMIPNIALKVQGSLHRHTGAKNGCRTCHLPHSSPFDRLLVRNFSLANYNLYPKDQIKPNPYALCFQCHDQEILAPGNQETGFRQDQKVGGSKTSLNLHWFHVVNATGDLDKGQGRSCRICHDPHGSDQDFNINSSWVSGDQAVPIVYTRASDGGTCTSTCHVAKTYRRF